MITLISETPVAGVVQRTANWIQRILGTPCQAFIKNNYSNNSFSISSGTFGCLPNWKKLLIQQVQSSRYVFLHNVNDLEILDIVFNSKLSSTKIFYQFHSPPGEPPLYMYEAIRKYQYSDVFAVAQGYGRFIDGSTLIPNIIANNVSHYKVEKSKSIITPHMRSTNCRWSNKLTEIDLNKISDASYLFSEYKLLKIREIFGRDYVSHDELLLFLSTSSIVIDDINTGLIHQTTIESIKAGCTVFSAADPVSIDEFCKTMRAPLPPLLYVQDINEVIKNLVNFDLEDTVIAISNKCRRYANRYLDESRIAQIYIDILLKQIPTLGKSL